MERQKQNYRIGFPIASIYSAKLRPNRLGPNIQNQQKIKGPIQQHCIPSARGRLRPLAWGFEGTESPPARRYTMLLYWALNYLSILYFGPKPVRA